MEVKLQEEEFSLMQQNLDRKMLEVNNLKKELQLKHERMTQVGSLLAKQECDEMVISYIDAAEYDALEKHKNDHLKTRLQLEMIDCQVQLTRALLKKRDIESKLEAMKHDLETSEKIGQGAQELHQKSAIATHINFTPQASNHSNNFGKSSLSTVLESNNSCKSKLDDTQVLHESLNRDMAPQEASQKSTKADPTHYVNVLTSTTGSGKCIQIRASSTARKRTTSQKLSPVNESKKND